MTQSKKLELGISSNFSAVDKDQIKALCKQFGLDPNDLGRRQKDRKVKGSGAPRQGKKPGTKKSTAAQGHVAEAEKPPVKRTVPEKAKAKSGPPEKREEPNATQQPQTAQKPVSTLVPTAQAPAAGTQKSRIFEVRRPTPVRRSRVQPSRRTSTEASSNEPVAEAVRPGDNTGVWQRGGRGKQQGFGFGKRRRKPKKFRRDAQNFQQVETDPNKEIVLVLPISVRSLSSSIGVKTSDIMTHLMKNKIFVNLNESLSEDVVELIALEFNKNISFRRERDLEEDLAVATDQETEDIQVIRAPVVAFLGHVDHGKTSLLDAIRQSNVVASEHGGITQHIGAYQVHTDHGDVTFLDTPGHEAFTAMRARGAQVTDIVVLVVAADDGIMPQTDEAIAHARAAGTTIVVAINKIDKPNANVERVKRQLAERDLLPESWGGSTITAEVSAVTKKGISELLELLALQAEVLELTASPSKKAVGTVLEARISEGRGIITDILVQDGTLHKGNAILCSHGFGRVRGIYNDFGQEIESAGPSTPIQVTGLSEVPETGDRFYVLEDFHQAKQIAQQREQRRREAELSKRAHVSLENLFSRIEEGNVQDLCLVIKADVQGSIEVLCDSVQALSTDEIKVSIIHRGVGGVNESDVLLADASDAVIIGYHVVAEIKAKQLAEQKGVEIRYYSVIFEAIADVRKAMEGMLTPERVEKVVGHVEIRQVFRISRMGNIAGCFVTDGFVTRTSRVRLVRDNTVIHEGKLVSLKRVKDDAKEVKAGFECGLRLENYDDIKVGDVLECFIVEEVARTLA